MTGLRLRLNTSLATSHQLFKGGNAVNENKSRYSFCTETSRGLGIFHRIHSKKQALRNSSNYEPLYGYLLLPISRWFFHEIVDFSTKSSLVYQKMVLLKIQTIENGSFVLPKIIGIHFSFVTKIPDDTLLTKMPGDLPSTEQIFT